MKAITSPVSTIATGLAASMGSILLSAGAKGRRFVMPHARVMIHQPSGGARGKSADMEIQMAEIIKTKELGAKILAENCGHSIEKILADFNRDYWMSAEESVSGLFFALFHYYKIFCNLSTFILSKIKEEIILLKNTFIYIIIMEEVMSKVKVKNIEKVAHNVVRLMLEKPGEILYKPGQATDITLDISPWEKEYRTFTFTSLPEENHLEFTIKVYPDHKGVTEQIGKLKAGDTINLYDVYGDIHYKGEGVFIAGGAGITPFISILRDLEKKDKIGNNKLIFANNKKEDIIDYEYFHELLGDNFTNVLSEEKIEEFENGYITKELIKSNLDNNDSMVYLCGPPPMMDAVLKQLDELGIDESRIVKEGF
jgi:ferredoxin-NADP reductase